MTIRSTIVLLIMPLFLGLALVNGALLYFQDRAELRRALNAQALVTAVTVAEFVREMDDPRAELAKPVRRKALQAALRHVRGIDSLYLLAPGQPPQPLKPGITQWDPAALPVPLKPASFSSGSGAKGDRWVTAVAPAGHGRFVASRFSTEPLHEHMDTVRRYVLAIILVLGLLAAGLGLFVARRITRELDANRRALSRSDGEAPAPGADGLLIREAQDLAGALRLMEASRVAAETRRQIVSGRQQRLRDLPAAVAETQGALFAPCTIRESSREIAMRLCGEAQPGAFFAHALTETGGTAVIGCCEAASPADALASAADARRQIERCTTSAGLDRTVERLCALYEFAALERCGWVPEDSAGLTLIAVTGGTDLQRARSYVLSNPGIAPEALLASLDVMLAPDGVFAAIGQAGSGNRGERGSDIGFDRKDRAEATDIKDFPH